jgi:hypothetical protein
VRARLINVEVPTSYYSFSTSLGNTTLRIKVLDNVLATVVPTQTIVIPNGNYNVKNLLKTLEEQLNTNAECVAQGIIFTVSLSDIDLKVTIGVSSDYKVVVDTTSVIQGNVNWGLAYNLGFAKNTVVYGNSVTGQHIINVNPNNYIVLEIPNLNTMDECLPPKGGQTRSVFAKIPITVNSYEIVFMKNDVNTLNENTFNPIIGKLDRIQIKWRFHNGSPIDFNNVEHSFTIELECVEVSIRSGNANEGLE